MSDNLVDFPTDPDAVEIAVGRWRIPKPSCRHLFVELTESSGSRRVYCRKCDETLDAFEILMRYARIDGKLRRQAKAWKELDTAWAWLWENRGALTLSRYGVKGSIKINGKRRSKKPHSAGHDGLAGMIINAVEALQMMKKWEPKT